MILIHKCEFTFFNYYLLKWTDGSTYSYRHDIIQKTDSRSKLIDYEATTAMHYLTEVYPHVYYNPHKEYIEELLETPHQNITNVLKCKAITTNLLMTHQWIPVDCDRVFENMTFLCEYSGNAFIWKIILIYVVM